VGWEHEWVLYLAEQNPKADNTWSHFVHGSGLKVRFFIASGCLGAKNWDYEIYGNPYHGKIDLYFLKQSGNYNFIRVLDDFVEANNGMTKEGSYFPNATNFSLENFREFMLKDFKWVKEIEFPMGGYTKWNFDRGIFGETVVCG
jgi:hypothetical protein